MRGNSRVDDVTVAWANNDEKDGNQHVTASQTVDQTTPGARGQGELTLQSSAFRQGAETWGRYREASPSSANVQLHLTSSFVGDGNAS